MKNEYSYKMKQIQKLALTKEMQLSIKVLQMSSQRLNEFLEEEFVENPVIEVSDNSVMSIKEEDFNIFNKKSKCINSNETSPLNFVSKEKSLKDYLHEQILEIEKDKVIRKTADYMVECLDEKGYLQVTDEEIIEKLLVTNEVLDKSINLLHSLEPNGIGARSLEECLIIQLEKLGVNDEKLIYIVNNNLEDIGRDDYKKIAKELSITKSEAQKYSNIIKKLEPKPSRGFYTGEDYKYIVPEAAIIKNGEDLEIIMNEGAVPRLVISNTYKNMLSSEGNEELAKYINNKISSAEFLIKSIEDRKNTLKRILSFIAAKQCDYFKGNKMFLKPMTIKEIAEYLDCSESTVSRAVKDKYILTDWGIISIKGLFSVNTIKCTKNDISVECIKSIIKRIISEEDKKSPVSDQEIVEMLKEKEITISRRTVAKYREELCIKSSHKRKVT